MAFSDEEIKAGRDLYEKEYFHLKPTFGAFIQKWMDATERREVTIDMAKARLADESWPAFRRENEAGDMAFEFVTNVARYYDILIKCDRAKEGPGERYLMNELAANIDRIKRTCNRSVGNELINPLDFTFRNAVVENGVLKEGDAIFPLVRSRYIPALLGSSGTSEEALTAYEYGIALGFATGLTYEWIYSIADDSCYEKYRRRGRI